MSIPLTIGLAEFLDSLIVAYEGSWTYGYESTTNASKETMDNAAEDLDLQREARDFLRSTIVEVREVIRSTDCSLASALAMTMSTTVLTGYQSGVQAGLRVTLGSPVNKG